MITINLLEWDVTYTELAKWAVDRDAEVYAVNNYGANIYRATYAFARTEDYLAFKLAFPKKNDLNVAGYKGHGAPDTSMYYCPYIPIIKNEKSSN